MVNTCVHSAVSDNYNNARRIDQLISIYGPGAQMAIYFRCMDLNSINKMNIDLHQLFGVGKFFQISVQIPTLCLPF